MATWGNCLVCFDAAWLSEGMCPVCYKIDKSCPHGRTTFCKYGCFNEPTIQKAKQKKHPILIMKVDKLEDEITETVPNPKWLRQFDVTGSSGSNYTVSQEKLSTYWHCSCPAWTRNTPRTDCKHILKVKLFLVNNGTKLESNVPIEKPNPNKTGRKFR